VNIDGHVHLGRWSDERFFGVEASIDDVERALIGAGLDGAAVTATDLRRNDSVLSSLDRARERGSASEVRVRYWFFPWVDVNDVGMMDFVGHHIDRIDGLKFHPSFDRTPATDRRYLPYVELAAEHALPVLLHCGRWQEMASYKFGIELASAHPGVDFILAHMGGDDPRLRIACVEDVAAGDLPNVYLDLAGVREYWCLERALDRVGSERLIFGSDFPLGHPRVYRALIDVLDLPDEVEAAVMGRNLLGLLSKRRMSE